MSSNQMIGNPFAPPSAVVFDLGGVVFNWQPMALLQQVLPQHAPDEAHAGALAGRLFEDFHPQSDWAQFDLGTVEPDDLARRIAHRTGLTAQEVLAVIHAIPVHLVPKAATVTLIQALHERAVPMYYLSNMPAPYADRLEASHGFFSCFRDGIFSARVGQIKPERPIFENANARFGVQGPTTLFIDDVRHNIEAAEAHGWSGLHFQSAAQCRSSLESLGLI